MPPTTHLHLAHLEDGLRKHDWKLVTASLAHLPTDLPTYRDPKTLTNAIEQARTTADLLAQACDFNLCFETSYKTREAILGTTALTHAISLLKSYTFEPRVIDRLANLFTNLCTTNAARNALGDHHVVDTLVHVWKKNQKSIPLIRCLVALTCGHIDNISQLARAGGLTTAIKLLRECSAPKHGDATYVVLQSVVHLVSMCAIATPCTNTEDGDTLVPTLMHTLQTGVQNDCVEIVVHTLTALANVGDCHIKEREGYALGNAVETMRAVVNAWAKYCRKPEVVTSASWAVVALLKADTTCKQFVQDNVTEILPLVNTWKAHYETASLLYTELTAWLKSSETPRASVRRHDMHHIVSTRSSKRLAGKPPSAYSDAYDVTDLIDLTNCSDVDQPGPESGPEPGLDEDSTACEDDDECEVPLAKPKQNRRMSARRIGTAKKHDVVDLTQDDDNVTSRLGRKRRLFSDEGNALEHEDETHQTSLQKRQRMDERRRSCRLDQFEKQVTTPYQTSHHQNQNRIVSKRSTQAVAPPNLEDEDTRTSMPEGTESYQSDDSSDGVPTPKVEKKKMTPIVKKTSPKTGQSLARSMILAIAGDLEEDEEMAKKEIRKSAGRRRRRSSYSSTHSNTDTVSRKTNKTKV